MRHPPYGFDIYLVNVKTIRRMAQIFVAFSEKLNFITITVKSTGNENTEENVVKNMEYKS